MTTDTGIAATVVGTTSQADASGVKVYNFTVALDHTYFVQAGTGLGVDAVWVHNDCAGPGYAGEGGSLGLVQDYLSGSGGRWGGAATRAFNDQVATQLEEDGLNVINGAGRRPEEWIPGPNGGTAGGTWVDITAQAEDGSMIRVQTIDTLADGVTPTACEAAAAARILAAFPNDVLNLMPKP